MCLGSVMLQHTMFNKPVPRSKDEVLTHARNFIEQYYSSMRRLNSKSHKNRWDQVEKSIKETGTYQLTETELTFGAKLAWRNAPRCIGRIQWSKLQVFDCRQVTTTTGMFEAICNHLKYGINKGNIRSAITIFPQRTDGKHDFKIWNTQLISYAGYKNPDGTITGDPLHVEFTELCMKLGWKGKGTNFDLLPLVLQSNGHDPDYFDYPPGLVMEVDLVHPQYEWFEELGLKWYVLPAVASMMLDCGGLEFTCAPFNGWYMGTEIGCRDLCDPKRYNICEKVAKKMGLDTRTNSTLWKDKAMVEVNLAVVYSFQKMNVTVVDHHTAAESFMKHYENEQKLRNGCPSDWIWIVPPLSSSITPVFHQELALYHLKPSYDYQEPAWKTHVWEKDRDIGKVSRKPRRKFHFKQLARAVKFTSRLFGKALSKRIKATILYATETGKSETFAKRLFELFGHAFNAQVHRMDAYDISNLEHEALVLVVTSTAGNGDPPENGLEFAQNLYKMKMDGLGIESNDDDDDDEKFSLASSKSFIKLNSQVEPNPPQLDRLDSMKGSMSDVMAEDTFGPLGNVRFAVFALGSSAYPNFCAFGKYVDNLLIELGGERLMKLTTGDEMCAQEQIFSKWARDVFNVSCETFCLEGDSLVENAGVFSSVSLKDSTVRFVDSPKDALQTALANCSNRKVITCQIIRRENLHQGGENGTTLKIDFKTPNINYEPGDHVGVFPCNKPEIVNGILNHLSVSDVNKSVQLQLLKENHTPNGVFENWESHDRLPACSLKTLFTRFLDITTPPSPNLLQYLASVAKNETEKQKLQKLATDLSAYEDWRHTKYPHLLEVFEEFPSTKPKPALLVAHLSPLQPRFYSISSSPLAHPKEIHLTVAVVTYRTQQGSGPYHYGVCSNYLNDIKLGEDVYVFIRSAPGFHLPSNFEKPLILVGPGTGIAPFRGFWHHRHEQLKALREATNLEGIWLFFGCRTRTLDLYKDEKEEMTKKEIISKKFLALSRESDIPKTYVQNLMRKEKGEIYRKIVEEKGHFYVCGDCTMADNVYQELKQIIQELGKKTKQEVESYMLSMRDENRYHEDIFGITLRTAEVQSRSRESARMRMESSSS
ncbi:Nitric-oxide synthase, salivary gland, putative [Pediculus humanus corporis]|uniref:Nitric oxide synthase n=1 Tax=Pediculus humanus subsp. corporis TaxID=121224 RepID=E0VG92_PEDHC|nr:Nitric-oxide synthase, salivary gland, putative [Pediculus humanus corporis]EEB12398.1 Nitric-oxide synthase, salivary gland, putative [Pediculus humanus corporis]